MSAAASSAAASNEQQSEQQHEEDAATNKITTTSNDSPFVSKYDILTVEKNGLHELYQSSNPEDAALAVGNNRFRILCEMNSVAYEKDDNGGDAVVDQVLDIVSKKCIDTVCQRAGKFFRVNETIAAHDTDKAAIRYTELTPQQARDFVRYSLEQHTTSTGNSADTKPSAPPEPEPPAPKPAPIDKNTSTDTTTSDEQKKRRRRSSLLRRSLSSGNMLEDQKKRVAYRKSILLQLQKLDADQDSSDSNNSDKQQHKNGGSPSRATAAGSEPPPLLRAGSWSENSREMIVTANPLDVIVRRSGSSSHDNQEKYTLALNNHTGNNRIVVMVQLQLQKFIAASNEQRVKMCREIVETVRDHYNGRFLVEESSSSDSSPTKNKATDEKDDTEDDDDDEQEYHALSFHQATMAVEAIFRSEQTISIEESSSSNSPPPASASARAPRPSVVKTQIIQQLHNMPTKFKDSNSNGGSGTVSDIHRVAIQSLQKRKQRQTTNSKISNLVSKSSSLSSSGRSQSVGIIPLPPGAEPRPILPAAFALNERYATTGMLMQPPPLPQQQPLFQPQQQQQRAVSDGGGDYLHIPPAHGGGGQHEEWTDGFHSPQAAANHSAPRRRMTARLSEFSQGMIEDLLVQLDTVDDSDLPGGGAHHQYRNHHM